MSERGWSFAARSARAVLRLYPRAWRERYAGEMEGLLQHHRVTLWTVADFLLGALDAHLHQDMIPGRVIGMGHRIRTSEVVIFCAFVLFGVAWLAAQQVRDPLPEWERIIQQHPDIRATLVALQIAGLVALLAVLIGGVPLVLAVIRGAVSHPRNGVLLLLATPIIAFIVLVGAVIGAAWLWSNAQHAGQPMPGGWQLALLGVFVLTVGGSTVAVALAVKRSEVGERLARFALLPAAVAVAAIAAGVVAAGIMTALSFVEAPELAPGNLAILTALMAVAAILAILALARGIAAARPTRA